MFQFDSNYERETTINFNDAEKVAEIYTCSRHVIFKLDKLCEKHPDLYKVKEQDDYSKTYIIPKKYISFRAPRFLTEEQKQKIKVRFENIRKSSAI